MKSQNTYPILTQPHKSPDSSHSKAVGESLIWAVSLRFIAWLSFFPRRIFRLSSRANASPLMISSFPSPPCFRVPLLVKLVDGFSSDMAQIKGYICVYRKKKKRTGISQILSMFNLLIDTPVNVSHLGKWPLYLPTVQAKTLSVISHSFGSFSPISYPSGIIPHPSIHLSHSINDPILSASQQLPNSRILQLPVVT